ncbi:MAG: TonB-dependent receptor [Candidatus Hydrogenedentes bacterium]|nr:TonB-dependent receptor [Candidatus Hydrogenedentota bacterium]
MTSRLVVICLFLFLISSMTLAQSDRGAITGTLSDSTGAVLPGVSVSATNVQTGSRYETVSTETGNYTLVQLPAGIYELSAELPGFKKSVRQGITVLVAQTLRINIGLELGGVSEAITVTGDAPLLRTESVDVSHNVATGRLDELPILGVGAAAAGSSGVRNPLAVTQLLPGTFFQPNTNVRVNGAPVNSQAIRVEGQDATNRLIPFAPAQTQPNVESIQEVTVQTSNYAAEYGQAGGGIFNYTMKSGTNNFHGSAYDYLTHENLNAGVPFTSTGGANVREHQRSNDYGFTFGGPIIRDRTFFFFSFEQFRDTQMVNTQQRTIPTEAFRKGDFSQVLTGRQLGTDPLGRPIMEGQIFDPATTRIVNGQPVRDPFPNNQIPLGRMDPVALKIQSMIPMPNTPDLVNNFRPSFPSKRYTTIPAFKVDHNLNSRNKLSFYWQRTETSSQFSAQFGGADGLPAPITQARGTFIESWISRVNWDYTISPTMLLHVGLGNQHNDFKDDAPTLDFDAQSVLGLNGGTLKRQFPMIRGLNTARGGMTDLGPFAQSRSLEIKPSGNASLVWVKNNHTYKFGSEFFLNGFVTQNFVLTAGQFNFAGAQTGQPFLEANTLRGGLVGFPYASFLLGLADTGNIASRSDSRLGKTTWGFYAQDTWKAMPTLTMDYGVRWDYFTYLKEEHGRLPAFSPTTPNPAAGGLLGASIFEGEGPGRCNCDFADNYEWAIGPRLGVAWQATPKWVARAGFGVSYSGTANLRPANVGSNNPFGGTAFGEPALRLQDGIPLAGAQVAWPKIDPGLFPLNGNPIGGGAPNDIDPQAGRPGRIIQWNIGVQREISPNLVVEAAYVGNRGAWLQANQLKDINALTQQRLASFGLDLNNAADRTLLASRLNSPVAAQRGFNTAPFPSFPVTATVAQALRPYPQFQSISSIWAPLGESWYDSLQVKATKRLSKGLDFSSAFTWQKELTRGAENENGGGAAINNVFNRDAQKQISSFSQPFTFVVAANYRFPQLNGNKVWGWVLNGWTYGTVLRYAKGRPIRVPLAQSSLNTLLLQNNGGAANGTNVVRVEGEPLFLTDINGDFNPRKEFVLNPKAWRDPAAGEFSPTASFLDEYRERRRPQESMSMQKTFRMNYVREGASLSVRIEAENIFNRRFMNNPDSTNANLTQTRDANEDIVSGFGRVNTATLFSNFRPRQAQVIVRFNF